MQETSKIDITFEKLKRALFAFAKALQQKFLVENMHIDASIQRFEFSVELSWKLLKHILESQGVQAYTPKEVIRQAYASQLINDEDTWLSMLVDRNQTSHTYNIDLAEEIYSRLPAYYTAMKSMYDKLQAQFKPTS